MALADELTQTIGVVQAAVPAPVFAAIAASITELQQSRIAEQAVGVGARPALPALPDRHGAPVDLAALLARGPLVLTFYRGGWCPYCNVTLRALQRVLGDIRALGAELVAITPELPDRADATAERAEASFAILHDAHNGFARALGLVFELPETLRPLYVQIGIDLPAYNGDATFTLPIAATYVIAPDGHIAWAFLDADFTRRAEPADVLAALRTLVRT